MAGKNQQQLVQVIKNVIEGHKDLLASFCTSAKLEATLLVAVQVCCSSRLQVAWAISTFSRSVLSQLSGFCRSLQVHCYEDNKLLKIFSDIVRLLYDVDIVGEDTIMYWCDLNTDLFAVYLRINHQYWALWNLCRDQYNVIYPHSRYSKGSHSKGRNVFLKDIEPFIKWLKEAEEEDEDEDDEEDDD